MSCVLQMHIIDRPYCASNDLAAYLRRLFHNPDKRQQRHVRTMVHRWTQAAAVVIITDQHRVSGPRHSVGVTG